MFSKNITLKIIDKLRVCLIFFLTLQNRTLFRTQFKVFRKLIKDHDNFFIKLTLKIVNKVEVMSNKSAFFDFKLTKVIICCTQLRHILITISKYGSNLSKSTRNIDTIFEVMLN